MLTLFSLVVLNGGVVFAKTDGKSDPENPQGASGTTSVVTNVGSSSYKNPTIAEIQQELQNIVQIHQTLQTQQYGQVRELQRIREQTKAHQQILKDLSPAPKIPKTAKETVARSPDMEEILRLEKIRLIQEQTRQNKAILEGIQKRAGRETQSAKLGGGKKAEKKSSPAVPKSSPTASKGKTKKHFWSL